MAKRSSKPSAPGVITRTRGDGSHVFIAWIPAGRAGAKRYLPAVPTLQQAIDLRARALRNLDALPEHGVTLQGAIDATVEEMTKRRVRPGTQDWFAKESAALVRAFGGGMLLAKLRPSILEHAVADWLESVSPSTVAHHRRALGLLVSTAIKRGWLLENPLAKVAWPKVEAAERPCLTPERVRELVHAIRSSGREGAAWDAALVELLFACGLRRAEVARLRVRDLRKDGTLWVQGKAGNTTLPLGSVARQAVEHLAEHAGEPDAWLIPGATEQERAAKVSAVFRSWAAALREPALTPHGARHHFITTLARNTSDLRSVMALARHKTPAMSLRYIHAAAEHRELLAAVDASLSKPPSAKRASKRRHRLRVVAG
ncbi:MAG: tyrosine-type recombinase/integrase [Planctomycetes bacterium]|nr:tyrosine-type recombinase/integrase [Planctomycetota bacterium]